MPSKNKPLTDAELDVYEAGRDLAADILQSIAEMKAGQRRTDSSQHHPDPASPTTSM